MTIWIVQDKNTIKEVLSSEAEAQLTFANHNFFAAHGHDLGIGNIDYELGESLWKGLHSSFAYALGRAMNQRRLEQIMDKHKNIIIKQNTFDISEVLEEYIVTVWAEFCFGDPDSFDIFKEYTEMRKLYLKTIRSTFYKSTTKLIPIIGNLLCRLQRFRYRNEFHKVDNTVQKFIINCTANSLFMEFEVRFTQYNEIHNVINPSLLNKLVLDNAFLSVLVLDFIYMIMLETLLGMIINKSDYNSKELKESSFRNGFLFPWRIRYMPHDYHIFKGGDYVVLNLVESELFFSNGPRSCIGLGLYSKFSNHLIEILKPFQITLLNPDDPIVRLNDENTPFILSKHIVKLTMHRDHLKTILPYSNHNGIKFYHVNEISNDATLYTWIVTEFTTLISNFMKKQRIDAIVSAEARGWIFASPVAHNLGLPLIVARKKGKLPGELRSITYKKEGYGDEETIELPVEIINRSVAIIDDGIASGVTNQALYDILLSGNNNVKMICNVIKYSYVVCKFLPPDDVTMISLFDL